MQIRCGLLLCLLLAGSAGAQDASAWLTRMGEALQTLDYEGDLVYSHAGQIETLRVFHAGGADGGRERLVSLNGVPREVIRSKGRVVCIGTGSRPAVYPDADASVPRVGPVPGLDAQRLRAHYALALGGSERIAEHDAQVLEVKPLDAYRYGFKLWLERDSGMLLKSLRFGADGRPVEQLMFTRIEIGRRPADADLGINVELSTARTEAPTPPQAPGDPPWHVLEPPAGFVLTEQQPPREARVEHLLYSDGIASVSVYVEALTRAAPAFSGPASRGGINLHSRVIDGHQITVLGDVPAATVERFAQNVAATSGG